MTLSGPGPPPSPRKSQDGKEMDQRLKERLVARATQEGFDACGLCRPGDVALLRGRLDAFLDAGYHGQMDWMERRRHWRRDPTALWPEARSVIMLAQSYTPQEDPMD